ncbi:hypothetical protein [uncultured Metabacillus sp.]|uniref:hypothetical protein n=1 Tax=uncultured Metabacillus sp. TaxID=2860135 RepID=UPI00262C2C8F|nr:hypothetical protein [uncultured Metabacillus sp.]
MIVSAWILLIPFGLLSVLTWLSIFLQPKMNNVTTRAWVIVFVSTLITAISAGIIFR